LQAHEREQLRQAGRRKLDELRALKAAAQQFIQAHKAAARQQGAFSAPAGVLGSSSIYQRDPAAAALSLTRHSSTEPGPTSQQAQQPESSPFISAARPSTPAQPACAVSPAQQPQTAQQESVLQASSSSAVAAAAAAVAAGAAAIAASASARAGVVSAGAPPAPAAVPTAAAAGTDDSHNESAATLQLLREQSLQRQQSLQAARSGSVATSEGVPAQDPMVEMLLQQVCLSCCRH
jgi:hypothetical protein